MGDSQVKEAETTARHQPEAPQNDRFETGRSGVEQKVNHELFTPGQSSQPAALAEASRLGSRADTPGYPMPGLLLTADKAQSRPTVLAQAEAGGKITDRPAEKPQRPALNNDGTVPLEPVSTKDVIPYLNGDGKGLPPIARDFKQIGINALRDKEAQDALKPQIHVAKTAGDNRYPLGSERNPYNSIQGAIDAAKPGTVINVHKNGNGSYNETLNILKSDIVLTTDPKNPAVIDLKNGRPQDGESAVTIGSGVHNVDIKNFEIKNFGNYQSAIKVEGFDIKNINIAGNNIHSANLAEAIRVYGTGATEKSKISNINILGNEVHDINLGELEAIPINGNVDGFRVIGNAGYKLNNIFIDAIGGEKVSRSDEFNQARNGEIDFNYAHGMSTRSNAPNNRHRGEYSAAAIYTDAAKGIKIRNNYIVGADFGIEVGSEHTGKSSTKVEVSGNIVQNAGFAWFGRGGDSARPGGASDSFANNNVVIGNPKDELQSNVERFPVSNNPFFKSVNDVTQLSSPIAALVRHNAKRARP